MNVRAATASEACESCAIRAREKRFAAGIAQAADHLPIQDCAQYEDQRHENDCQNDRGYCWISPKALNQSEAKRNGKCFGDRRVHQFSPTHEPATPLAAAWPARGPTSSSEPIMCLLAQLA